MTFLSLQYDLKKNYFIFNVHFFFKEFIFKSSDSGSNWNPTVDTVRKR